MVRQVAVAMIGAAVLLVCAQTATAGTCTKAQRSQLRAAGQLVNALPAGAAGRADAAAVVARAGRRCAAAGFAHAVATLTTRRGAAVAGQPYRVGALLLRGSAVGTYRLDLDAMTATLASGNPAGRATRLRRISALGSAQGRATKFSPDPSSGTADGALQLLVAERAHNSQLPAGADLARRSLAALRNQAARRQLTTGPLLPALAQGLRLARLAHQLGDATSLSGSRAVAAALGRRVRRSNAGSWARVDGHYATLAQQRQLVRRAGALERLHPNAAIRATVARLAGQLRSKPTLSFARVPAAAFYPWPADGTRDTSQVTLRVDKPASIALTVFSSNGTPLRIVRDDVVPGTWSGIWNGSGADGSVAVPGSYRYALRAIDRAGNARTLPGLGAFVVARDTIPPAVRSGSVTLQSSMRRRRILAIGWKVHEPLSPRVSVALVIRSGAFRKTVPLRGNTVLGATTTSLRLGAGSYRTLLRVTDGSGNVSLHDVGRLKVP